MLTDQEFEFLAGCVIGDGCVHSQSKAARHDHQGNPDYKHYDCYVMNFSHTKKQEFYLRWKAQIVSAILGTKGKVRERVWKTLGKEYPAVEFAAGSNELIPIYEGLYINQVKTFTPDFLNKLGLIALSLFWMDDGCLSFSYKTGVSGQQLIKDRSAMLSVCNTKQQCSVVGDWIQSLTGAAYKFVPHKKSGTFYLRWTADDMRLLVRTLEPYIFPHKEMRYKVDLKYDEPRPVYFSTNPNNQMLVNDWDRLKDDKTPRAPSIL